MNTIETRLANTNELFQDRDLSALVNTKEGSPTIPQNSVLSMGFGAGLDTPLRIVSYPLAAYELLKRRPDTTLELYVATQFPQLVNITSDEARNTEEITQNLVTAFMQTFYPTIAPRVSFLPSTPITVDQQKFIYQTLVPILERNSEIQSWAYERNGIESLIYIAAHSLYMRDPLPIDPALYINKLTKQNQPIVMIGGRGERRMWEARKEIIRVLGGELPSQIFTTLGQRPPYFSVESEPTCGERVTNEFLSSCSPELYRDFAYLIISLAKNVGDFELQYDQVALGSNARGDLLRNKTFQTMLSVMNEFSTLGRTL